MDFTKAIEWLKLSAHQLFWVFLSASVILSLPSFVPDELLETFSLGEHRIVISRLWILSLIGLVATGGKLIFEWTKAEITSRRRMKLQQKRLHQLTPAERAILGKYFTENTRTQNLSLRNGNARGLVAERILFCPNNSIGNESSMPHNIRPWAWDYLKKHPELLKD